ncbi:MAG: sigma-70 family RNA polymerase sigma factor [Clostridia bacterium]|nr:sigma-70 family RNA polymerase sigma factor [Clostridia bacterium]
MREGNYGNALQTAVEPLRENAAKDYSENLDLIRLIQTGEGKESERAMEKILSLNAGLLRNLAYRFRDRGVDMEDLLQIGTIGMIKAARSFDLERGTCFSTYAVPLVFGELRRHMRDEGPIKVGRYYKRLSVSLMNAKQRIQTEEGREPHIGELAEACGVSVEEAAMALEASSPIVSLSERAFGDEDGMEWEAMIADEGSTLEMEQMIDKMALGQAIGRMSEFWQRIVALRYYRNLTQQQTAEALGVTQVKISREEKKIVEFLRGELVEK